jgi:hypothetical protein
MRGFPFGIARRAGARGFHESQQGKSCQHHFQNCRIHKIRRDALCGPSSGAIVHSSKKSNIPL